jgi:hypothetical protein
MGPDIAGGDRVNLPFIALIVAVATIGGFMFGYDSGVINGTQDGLERRSTCRPSAPASTSAPSCSAARPAPSSPAGWRTRSAARR